MVNVLPFFAHHLILTSGFAVALFLTVLYETAAHSAVTHKIPTVELIRLMNNENAVVIDLRAKDVYKKGHIIGAYNLMQDEILKKIESIAKDKALSVVLVCYEGVSAEKQVAPLKSLNYEKVFVLDGGMRSWIETGLPVE
jgi:rhodanese-related sulfurtransferase